MPIQPVAQAAVIGKFRNNGQVCIAPPGSISIKIAKEFTEAAVESPQPEDRQRTRAGVQVGPMIEKPGRWTRPRH